MPPNQVTLDKHSFALSILTCFRSVFPFYNPGKYQKAFGFFTFSRDIESEHRSEIEEQFKIEESAKRNGFRSNLVHSLSTYAKFSEKITFFTP